MRQFTAAVIVILNCVVFARCQNVTSDKIESSSSEENADNSEKQKFRTVRSVPNMQNTTGATASSPEFAPRNRNIQSIASTGIRAEQTVQQPPAASASQLNGDKLAKAGTTQMTSNATNLQQPNYSTHLNGPPEQPNKEKIELKTGNSDPNVDNNSDELRSGPANYPKERNVPSPKQHSRKPLKPIIDDLKEIRMQCFQLYTKLSKIVQHLNEYSFALDHRNYSYDPRDVTEKLEQLATIAGRRFGGNWVKLANPYNFYS